MSPLGREAATLTILLATCETSLQAFQAADNPIDRELMADLERVIVRTRASTGSPKAEPAAVRWLARLALERPRTTIGELQLAAAALAQLSERPKTAARTLLELAS